VKYSLIFIVSEILFYYFSQQHFHTSSILESLKICIYIGWLGMTEPKRLISLN